MVNKMPIMSWQELQKRKRKTWQEIQQELFTMPSKPLKEE